MRVILNNISVEILLSMMMQLKNSKIEFVDLICEKHSDGDELGIMIIKEKPIKLTSEIINNLIF